MKENDKCIMIWLIHCCHVTHVSSNICVTTVDNSSTNFFVVD